MLPSPISLGAGINAVSFGHPMGDQLHSFFKPLGQESQLQVAAHAAQMTMLPTVDLTPLIQQLLLEMTKLGATPMLDVVALSECGELITGSAKSEAKSPEAAVLHHFQPQAEPTTSRLSLAEQENSQRKRVFDKPCAICHGAASGYHYETPSCNSCKTFFRRTVISAKNYKCIKGDGQCLNSGKIPAKIKCRQCRFLKCIQQGMRPETVSTSKEWTVPKVQEMPQIQQYSPAESPISSDNSEVSSSPQLDMAIYNYCISSLGEIDEKIKVLRNSDFDPYKQELGLFSILAQTSLLDRVEQFNTVTDWMNHPRISPSRGPCVESPSCRDLSEWLCLDLICAVEYMKRFSLFNALPFEDKCMVIKRVALPLSIAVLSFDSVVNGHSTLMLPDGISPVSILPTVFFNVCDPWKRENVDQTEYLFLKALLFHEMMLMTHSTPELLEDKAKYTNYLMDYLRKKVGHRAPLRYGALVSISQHLIRVAHKHRAHVLLQASVYARPQERLVREIILQESPVADIDCNTVMH
ncbi:unnamed protein product, partial [Mesorhabditis spiculigera]